MSWTVQILTWFHLKLWKRKRQRNKEENAQPMAEYIRFQNIKNPKIQGVCTLEEFQQMNEKQALRGKYRIVQRNIPVNESTRSMFEYSPNKRVADPPEALEAQQAQEARVEEAKTATKSKRKRTKKSEE